MQKLRVSLAWNPVIQQEKRDNNGTTATTAQTTKSTHLFASLILAERCPKSRPTAAICSCRLQWKQLLYIHLGTHIKRRANKFRELQQSAAALEKHDKKGTKASLTLLERLEFHTLLHTIQLNPKLGRYRPTAPPILLKPHISNLFVVSPPLVSALDQIPRGKCGALASLDADNICRYLLYPKDRSPTSGQHPPCLGQKNANTAQFCRLDAQSVTRTQTTGILNCKVPAILASPTVVEIPGRSVIPHDSSGVLPVVPKRVGAYGQLGKRRGNACIDSAGEGQNDHMSVNMSVTRTVLA